MWRSTGGLFTYATPFNELFFWDALVRLFWSNSGRECRSPNCVEKRSVANDQCKAPKKVPEEEKTRVWEYDKQFKFNIYKNGIGRRKCHSDDALPNGFFVVNFLLLFNDDTGMYTLWKDANLHWPRLLFYTRIIPTKFNESASGESHRPVQCWGNGKCNVCGVVNKK